MSRTRVTLADIAARVQVSSKTVSNVVNNTGWVGDEVRARVLAAIDELGYRPNLAARHLRSGSSGAIALAIPTLTEPYFAELASVFVDLAQERGLTVLVAQTRGNRDTEVEILEGFHLPALDGLVLSSLGLTAADLQTRRQTIPLVLIGEHGEGIAGPEDFHVGIDNVAAAAAATEELLKRGCRQIATVGVKEEGAMATSRHRFEGYSMALREAGLPVDPSLSGHVHEFNRAEGSMAVARLLDAGATFDGLLCFNDSLALGALYTLGVRGISVPGEVKVMGFDDIAEGHFSIPPYSTVDLGRSAVAEKSLDLILAPDRYDPGHHEVPFSLVRR